MRERMSCLSLMMASTFYKSLAVILAVSGIQLLYLNLTLKQSAGEETLLRILERQDIIYMAFAAGWLLLYLILVTDGSMDSVTRRDYTLMRLGVPLKEHMIWSAGYYMAVLTLYLTLQIVCIRIAWMLYVNACETIPLDTEFLLTICEERFWHALLPIRNLSLILRNLLMVAAFGVNTAFGCWRGRMSQKQPNLLTWLIGVAFFRTTAVNTTYGSGELDVVWILVWIAVLVFSILGLSELERDLGEGEERKSDTSQT